jgi:hypothetical protein
MEIQIINELVLLGCLICDIVADQPVCYTVKLTTNSDSIMGKGVKLARYRHY